MYIVTGMNKDTFETLITHVMGTKTGFSRICGVFTILQKHGQRGTKEYQEVKVV